MKTIQKLQEMKQRLAKEIAECKMNLLGAYKFDDGDNSENSMASYSMLQIVTKDILKAFYGCENLAQMTVLGHRLLHQQNYEYWEIDQYGNVLEKGSLNGVNYIEKMVEERRILITKRKLQHARTLLNEAIQSTMRL
jgi:hypothetical protein